MGAKIFKSTNHWKNTACINPDHVENWLYIKGFQRAGEALSEEVMRTHRDQDFLVFPILYCYRHFVELALKDILVTFRSLHDQPFSRREFYGHELAKLWEKARPEIVEHFSQSDPSELKPIDDMIETLDKLDPKGESFRYEGTPFGESHIGIDTVKLKMDEVGVILGGISVGLSADLSGKQEMEREYACYRPNDEY